MSRECQSVGCGSRNFGRVGTDQHSLSLYRYQGPRLSTLTALAARLSFSSRSWTWQSCLRIIQTRGSWPIPTCPCLVHVSPARCRQHSHWPSNSTSTATARAEVPDLRIAELPTLHHMRVCSLCSLCSYNRVSCLALLRTKVHARPVLSIYHYYHHHCFYWLL